MSQEVDFIAKPDKTGKEFTYNIMTGILDSVKTICRLGKCDLFSYESCMCVELWKTKFCTRPMCKLVISLSPLL